MPTPLTLPEYNTVEVLLEDTLIVGQTDLHTGDHIARVAIIRVDESDTTILMTKVQLFALVHALLVTAEGFGNE